jgi:phosphoribosylanthranilate isomerase
MAKIKICGITRKEDIVSVNKYIPEYIGFVFAKSRRRISPRQAARISVGLNGRILKVGVFVNEKIDEIVSVVKLCGLRAVQIHGDETVEYFNSLREKLDASAGNGSNRTEIWKALRVKDYSSLKELTGFKADAYVLDAYVEGSYGGAGQTFNWDIAASARSYGKIILAGGLDKNNVLLARDSVQPYALDVSSGVETEGYKDENKIRDFICVSRSY